jgi:RNA polymerase sigma-70 factor (ECF subfamily)
LSDRVAQPQEANDSITYLYKALNDLSTMERALMFQYLEGLSGRDIALNLGISEGAVRVKINRTKNKLKTILLSYGYEYE